MDACWGVARTLRVTDPTLGSYFQTRMLLYVLRHAEAYRLVYVLALEAGYLAIAGDRTRARVERMLEQATTIARSVDLPQARAVAMGAQGFAAFVLGRFPEAVELSDRAVDFVASPPARSPAAPATRAPQAAPATQARRSSPIARWNAHEMASSGLQSQTGTADAVSVRMYRNAAPVVALVVVASSCSGSAPERVPLDVISAAAKVQQSLDPNTIPKFVDPLPLPARIDATTGEPITMTVSEFPQQVLPATSTAGVPFSRTLVWGYNGSYPGPTIEARRGVPVAVTYVNDLVNPVLQGVLKIDQTLAWADPRPGCPDSANPSCNQPYSGPVPVVTHLHDGEVPAAFDGGPNSWFTPGLAATGPSFVSNHYDYNNSQEAGTLWYHDHALGITRLNVYAGLAGFYLLRDPINEPGTLPGDGDDTPGVNGPFEREVVIQDRMFDVNGQLTFPSAGINPTVHPFWIPEFFGNVIVVNGKSWPFLDVEPRKYRFRFLNGSNARFYDLAFDNKTPFTVIGADGAYHDAPAQVGHMVLAPGERVQVVVDFAGLRPGTRMILTNSAKAPSPAGAPPDPRTVGQIMQFRVVPATVTDPSVVPANLRQNNPIVRLANPVVKRQLTLNEVMGPGGPLQILLNNRDYKSDVTERPRVGATEQWEIINLTADTHPIHLHLVHMQVLDRQPIQSNKYLKAYAAAFGGAISPGSGPPLDYETLNGDGAVGGNPAIGPFLQQAPTPPDPTESGWKDTIRAYPGEVTRILVRWAPTYVRADEVSAGTNTFPFDPTVGDYVWHCHILDHEDNEMMRPMKVVP